MKVRELPLTGLLLIEPDIFRDDRGLFHESYNRRRYAAVATFPEFVQDNHSRSKRRVLRGIHLQRAPNAQAKLVRCARGEIWDVAVDLRPDSPTCGRWHAEMLSGESMRQLFIPEGFGHAFVTLSEWADVEYKASRYYQADSEVTILWNDPQIGIDWPESAPLLSAKDKAGMSLETFKRSVAEGS